MAVGLPTKANWAAGDVLTASQMDDLAGTLNTVSAPLYNAAGKNVIINGAFNVWQRGTSFSFTAGGTQNYCADRFFEYQDGTGTVAATQQAFTPGTAPVAGYESAYFQRLAVTATGTSSFMQLGTRIEDVRTYAGQTATLSFWAKADSARSSVVVAIQSFGSGGSAANVFGTPAITYSTSWTRYSFTFAVPSVAGKTIGSGSYVEFDLRTGFASGSILDVWGVQFEAGSTATGFQTATGTLQGELAACQRYYYRNSSASSSSAYYCYGLGNAYSITRAAVFLKHPQTMRTSPSFAYSGSVQIVQGSSGNSISAISIDNNSPDETLLNVTTSGIITGYGNQMSSSNNNTSYIELNAEL